VTAQPTIPNPRRSPGDEMLTLQEACAFLRVPEGTLRYWRHLGCGPHSFKVGRHFRYWRVDLVLWLAEQSNRSGAAELATGPTARAAPRQYRRGAGRRARPW
jgi:hypothetical protein